MDSEYLDESHTIRRKIDSGYFPMSPVAGKRESIFSVVLASVLESDPNGSEIEDLKQGLKSAEDVDISDDDVDEVWDVFCSSYITQGKNSGNLYIIPFHPAVAQSVRPYEARNWGAWYQMLMYDGEEFNKELHDKLQTYLREEVNASNAFEELFVRAAESVGYDDEKYDLRDIPPYVQACADVFQDDIEAWLDENRLSSSEWLQNLRDLFCFHAVNYFVQLSVNLRREFDRLDVDESEAEEDDTESYTTDMVRIPYGLVEERASNGREFAEAWDDRGPRGISGDIFDSWGRLGVMVLIEDAIDAVDDGDLPSVVTPTTFTQDRFNEACEVCIQYLRNRLKKGHRPDKDAGFAQHAVAYADAVRRHYEALPGSRQTPSSSGIRVVTQLGEGDRRSFINQRGTRPTFRLSRGSLRFFARLFELQESNTHYDRFISFLRERGIFLDDQSIDAIETALDEMGMISQKSDSGDAIYVKSV